MLIARGRLRLLLRPLVRTLVECYEGESLVGGLQRGAGGPVCAHRGSMLFYANDLMARGYVRRIRGVGADAIQTRVRGEKTVSRIRGLRHGTL